MADDSRAVRILSDLCGALRRDKKICEFGFVYCPEPLYNKSPIVVVDGNLGIETWSLKLLYSYAYSQLFHGQQGHHDLKRVSECSMAVLLLNPECLSAWNLRKQLVLKKFLKPDEELKFAQLVLSKHPKSPDTFCQRRWLLLQLYPAAARSAASSVAPSTSRPRQNADPPLGQEARVNDPRPVEDEALLARVQTEVDVCSLAASRYPSNYNAWSHRIWVAKNLAGSPLQFLRAELDETKSWVSVHLSDHSGFHYRQFLLRELTELLSPQASGGSDWAQPRGVVLEELQLILDLVTAYPGHEAVWYHRRFVVYLWKTLLCNGTALESSPSSSERACCSTSDKPSKAPSGDDEVRDCRAGTGIAVENPQIGNRRGEDQPVGMKDPGHRPIGNGPSENGYHREAGLDWGCVRCPSASQQGGVGREHDTPLAPMQPSTCSHDASLLHHNEQRVRPARLPPQTPCPLGGVQQPTHGGGPSFKAHASPSGMLRPLMQHERRFVECVVGNAPSSENAAQRKFAEGYLHWLDHLH